MCGGGGGGGAISPFLQKESQNNCDTAVSPECVSVHVCMCACVCLCVQRDCL